MYRRCIHIYPRGREVMCVWGAVGIGAVEDRSTYMCAWRAKGWTPGVDEKKGAFFCVHRRQGLDPWGKRRQAWTDMEFGRKGAGEARVGPLGSDGHI